MSDFHRSLDRALSREPGADMRWAGESFCADCPDREACSSGYPCDFVRRVDAEAAARRLAELEAAADAAYEHFAAVATYYSAASDAHVAASSALAAALIEHQEKP